MAKLIPNSDADFLNLARHFALHVPAEPSRFGVSESDARLLARAVKDFEEKFMIASLPGSRSQVATREKNESRAHAKRIICRLAQMIRINEEVEDRAKALLNLPQRLTKLKRQICPMEPPRLRFARALHGSVSASPLHELKFSALDFGKTKPQGAVRLELFVDLIPPDAPIPNHPGDNHGGRPWYLRSFTRSPIVITPPLARVPMRVIYWARWADSTGNVGPFSCAVSGWVEGGFVSQHGLSFARQDQPKLLDVAEDQSTHVRQETYTVALIEARCVSFNPQRMETTETMETERPTLETTVRRETMRIEGPAEEATAER